MTGDSHGPIHFTAVLLQNDPALGLWLRIPAHFIAQWGLSTTTTVEGTIGGHSLGRRAIKDSGSKTDDWYLALTKPLTQAIGGQAGDRVEVELHLADMTLPEEIAMRLAGDESFAHAWDRLSANHRRKAIEHYREAKTPAGRDARLEKIARSIIARTNTL